jgi:macrolide-specific efflux system membrane fusion protein
MKKLYITIIVIVVVAAGLLFVKKRKSGRPHSPEHNAVTVERRDLELKVLCTGTIQPYTRVEVKSPVRGRIDRIEVEEGQRVRKGAVLAWISSDDRVALMDAARSDLRKAQGQKNGEEIEEARTAYEIADKAYKPISLSTSISGEIIKRSCEPGQNVSLENVLFVLSDRLVAGVEVDEADIGKIMTGQEATIVLDAFPDENVKAEVTKISREARVVSNVTVYDVMVNSDEVPAHWASGMTANVEFLIESRKGVLAVPRSAVKQRKGKEFVMVMTGKPTPRKIETGLSEGRMIEVVNGLEEGEEIVLVGGKKEMRKPNALRRGMWMMRKKK